MIEAGTSDWEVAGRFWVSRMLAHWWHRRFLGAGRQDFRIAHTLQQISSLTCRSRALPPLSDPDGDQFGSSAYCSALAA